MIMGLVVVGEVFPVEVVVLVLVVAVVLNSGVVFLELGVDSTYVEVSPKKEIVVSNSEVVFLGLIVVGVDSIYVDVTIVSVEVLRCFSEVLLIVELGFGVVTVVALAVTLVVFWVVVGLSVGFLLVACSKLVFKVFCRVVSCSMIVVYPSVTLLLCVVVEVSVVMSVSMDFLVMRSVVVNVDVAVSVLVEVDSVP